MLRFVNVEMLDHPEEMPAEKDLRTTSAEGTERQSPRVEAAPLKGEGGSERRNPGYRMSFGKPYMGGIGFIAIKSKKSMKGLT